MPRVLLVDDFTDTRELLADLLRHNGYEVAVARNGWEAAALAKRESPDVVLVDLSQPHGHAWTLTPWLTELPHLRAIPVLGLTGSAIGADARRALDCGCTGYVLMPASPREILEGIHQVCARQAAPDPVTSR